MYRLYRRIIFAILALFGFWSPLSGQINTDQVIRVGRNALYFEDYMLSIQYFNQVIATKPYLAQPYFYRALAKFNLEDYRGAIEDASIAIEHNPFVIDAYELRAVAKQNLGDNEGAIQDYDKVLATLPENRSILFNKALAQEDLKDWDAAGRTFEKLLAAHPGYDGGYLGRAKMLMAKGDTVAAQKDIDHALKINKNAVNGYVMRADIAINSSRDFEQALADMNEAIKLQPHYAGFFINRAFLRHRLDDYFGAMSDYDYAIELDPLNPMAYYNRALLRAEVHDYDKSIADLTQVLTMRPSDYRSLYNRAVIYNEKGAYEEALKDINKVLEAYPDLAAAYFLRFDIKRGMGDKTAQEDYDHSLALAKTGVKRHADDGGKAPNRPSRKSGTTTNQAPTSASDKTPGETPSGETPARDQTVDPFAERETASNIDEEPQEVVAARFSQLLTVSDNSVMEQQYNNKSIRGRVQDRNVTIDIEPMFTVSYYSSPTELKMSGDYLREAEELNRTRTLRFLLQVTNHEPSLTDPEEINRHFESIEYYNSYLSTHTPRAVDYFGRGMDFMTLHDYSSAVEDFSRAIATTPDFTLAFYMRAIARYMELTTADATADDKAPKTDRILAARERDNEMAKVMEDIDRVIKLSPDMALAYYNKGVLLTELHDYTSALGAFNRAIELKPDLGEAFYNRGYVYFRLGNRPAGTADLSKAGELGVVPSYNLLKRMSR